MECARVDTEWNFVISLKKLADLDQLLLLEGWSLHQRLNSAMGQGIVKPNSRVFQELDIWRGQIAPDNPANFDKRLDWDSLSEFDAAWALDPPAEAAPQSPEWWPLLGELRKAACASAAEDDYLPLESRGLGLPFVHAWRPAAAWALHVLRRRCMDLESSLHLSERSWLDLTEALLERICTTTDQALWELFNQRRTPGQMLLAHLGSNGDGKGEPVHEAYDVFIAELLESGYGLLLVEFPVLGRLLSVVIMLWLEASEEMLRRLADSRPELQQHFAIDQAAPLETIQLGLSDPHRGGRVVAILSFGESDRPCKVVYKPKDMQVDATYQQFINILNQNSSLPALRSLTVLSRSGYGFMEWVEHRPCTSEEELACFYTNAGRIVALLYLLGCTDCHYENLIAVGDQLLLIDTETLLEADLRDLISDDEGDPSISDLQLSLQGSVLRSGLLPQWVMAGAGRKRAYDISALGIQPPPAESDIPGWLGINSDGMMQGKIRVPSSLPTSLPVGLGSSQRLTDFVEELINGLNCQLQDSLQFRKVILEAIEAFSGQPRRLVCRATQLYFTIQRQMLEPASLRTAFGYGLKIELLSRSFVISNEKPLSWQMFKAEILQMERLDIPFFEHLIDGEDLPLYEGLEAIPGFMKLSGLQAARFRIENLDHAEIEFQEQLIRGSIAARHIKISALEQEQDISIDLGSLLSHDEFTLNSEKILNLYLDEAYKLGEELWNSAIRDKRGRPEWLGMDLGADGEAFGFGLIGNSLYSGSSGIALLFMGLSLACNGEESTRWLNRAWSCFEGFYEFAQRNSNDQLFRLLRDQPLGMSGTGGILQILGILHNNGIVDAGLLENLLIDNLRPVRIQADENLDVIGGVAGLIGPLLASSRPEAQELAVVCGRRLLNLQMENGGWQWGMGSSIRRLPLTGFSHGAAGMGAALAVLAYRTGDSTFSEGAIRAVAYERSVFNKKRSNWPDFRLSSDGDDYMLSWCHGAPGILLSRHIMKNSGLADENTESEIKFARNTTLEALKRATNSSVVPAAHLCCGVLGLTSLLRVDSVMNSKAVHSEVVNAEIKTILQAKALGCYSFFSVDNGNLNLPGFFTGTAGVALTLLEAAKGQRWMHATLSAGLLLA